MQPKTPPTKAYPEIFLILLLVMADAVLACGGVSSLLRAFLPLWASLTVGIPLGVVLLFGFYSVSMAGGVDSMDFIVTHCIIYVLAGILFPVFSSARNKARTATCLSRTRTASLGVLLYAQDWEETFPASTRWSEAALTQVPAKEASTVLRCPNSPAAYGYAFNSALGRLPEDKVSTPETVILLFEANAAERNMAGDQRMVVHPPRHSGANNYTFADGHAKSVKADGEFALLWNVGIMANP